MVSRISGDRLFLPEIDLDRYPREIPLFPNLILQEAAVGILDILGQIDEAGELGRGCRQLHHVFDFDVFAFGRRGRIIFDDRQQVVVQRRGGHAPLAVFVNPDGGLEHFEDALFVEYRGEDDRNVVEGRQFFCQDLFPLLHRVVAFFHQIPFIDYDHAPFAMISYWAFSRSTIAFFIMDWISEGLNNLDFTLAALATQNLPSFGMYSSQGRFFVP